MALLFVLALGCGELGCGEDGCGEDGCGEEAVADPNADLASRSAALEPGAARLGEGEPEPSGAEGDALLEAALAAEPLEPGWPGRVDSLLASTERFVSREACVRDLAARTPTEVVEVLLDMGYGDVLGDVCAGLEAAATRDAARCDELAVLPVRSGCRRRVATLLGDPTLCPDDPVLEGREPRCVAWAARRESLCAAVAPADRDACVAVLRGDARGCTVATRPRCEAWIARYRPALGDLPPPSSAPSEPPRFTLQLERVHPGASSASGEGASEGEAPPPTEHALSLLDRGVTLVAEGCALRLHVGERPRLRTTLGARLDLPLPAAPAADDVPPDGPITIAIAPGVATLELIHPELGAGSAATGAVTLSRLEPTLGGVVEGTLTAEVALRLGALRVTGSFRSFVRDVDSLPAHCAGGRMRTP